ncbi:major histocompatibility complex class I-related gene protein-like isoform X3 [Thamnophis elegans]|uniref:major histocompatibility complex class I-related gene protein-like isoform X3 n=1 Tax=Thamnophis elegans TaxID=35005 RepID=UPI0013773163|nr:major histocompatibility complex class I-related gene protein-like isoform X3 [Thamnophis elegans]
MALRSATLWFLVLEVVALPQMCLGSSSHSVKVAFFAVWEPSQRLSHVVVLGYLDDELFARYDSNSKKIQPRVSWMEKSRKDIPQYWQALTDAARSQDDEFRRRMENSGPPYNKNRDLHTEQLIAGCELWGNGSEREIYIKTAPNLKGAYTFRAPVHPKMEVCIELLEKCLFYRNETLMRTETPVVTVNSRTEVEDGMEMHICQIYGFYPREINASWRRNEDIWLKNTLHGSVAPNADGTYHYWLSIRINPKERGCYECYVEHDGLQEPLALALAVPESNLGLIIGCVVAGLVMVCVIVGTLMFLSKYPFGGVD